MVVVGDKLADGSDDAYDAEDQCVYPAWASWLKTMSAAITKDVISEGYVNDQLNNETQPRESMAIVGVCPARQA